ncbi:MAG TPA: DUF1707 domain-containing protein [Trebonia sp.]|nr:DUF1707 domain-containing protein [Trebonia sp.]
MASDHIRASDHDRDAVVGALKDAYTEGRLSLEEFQERSSAAYAGRTWGDLTELTTDLPVQPALGTDLPEGALPPDALPAAPQGQAPGPAAQPASRVQPGPGTPYPEHPPFTGRPLYPGQPPYPFQLPGAQEPPEPGQSLPQGQPERPPQPGRVVGRLLPLVGMWMLFSLLARTGGGAVVFLIAVVVLVVLASAGRKGGRGH